MNRRQRINFTETCKGNHALKLCPKETHTLELSEGKARPHSSREGTASPGPVAAQRGSGAHTALPSPDFPQQRVEGPEQLGHVLHLAVQVQGSVCVDHEAAASKTQSQPGLSPVAAGLAQTTPAHAPLCARVVNKLGESSEGYPDFIPFQNWSACVRLRDHKIIMKHVCTLLCYNQINQHQDLLLNLPP